MKKIILSLCVFSSLSFYGCAELNQVASQLPTPKSSQTITDFQISGGLKEALQNGVFEGVTLLNTKDGYFGNELVKILLPDELKKVDNALRKIGLSNLADEGLKVLNRAAEDAAKEAKPIFLNAIQNMSFQDAKGILLGNDLAATNYLQNKTSPQLVAAFQPKIQNSLDKVGANAIWENIITQYNQIPFTKKVSTNLTEYVTNQAVKGVFIQIGNKEKDIRNNVKSRTTSLLRNVFALQD